jgi:hypothetical protein
MAGECSAVCDGPLEAEPHNLAVAELQRLPKTRET